MSWDLRESPIAAEAAPTTGRAAACLRIPRLSVGAASAAMGTLATLTTTGQHWRSHMHLLADRYTDRRALGISAKARSRLKPLLRPVARRCALRRSPHTSPPRRSGFSRDGTLATLSTTAAGDGNRTGHFPWPTDTTRRHALGIYAKAPSRLKSLLRVARRGQRITSTGTVLRASTSAVWLPSRTRVTPRRPCEVITSRSLPQASAVSMMPSAA